MILFVIVMTRIQEKSAAVVAPNVIALTDLVQRQVHSLSYLSSEETANHNIKLPCLNRKALGDTSPHASGSSYDSDMASSCDSDHSDRAQIRAVPVHQTRNFPAAKVATAPFGLSHFEMSALESNSRRSMALRREVNGVETHCPRR